MSHEQYSVIIQASCLLRRHRLQRETGAVIPTSLLEKQHTHQERSLSQRLTGKAEVLCVQNAVHSMQPLPKILFFLSSDYTPLLCEEITWSQDSPILFPIFWGLFLSTIAYWPNRFTHLFISKATSGTDPGKS